MKVTLLCIFFYYIQIGNGVKNSSNEDEDQTIINETIAKYGQPQDCQELGLPGPEFAADDEKQLYANLLEFIEPGVYTLKTRAITENFSYNSRYEEASLNKTAGKEIPIVKGLFGEHFPRKTGGFYIRTIEYTVDEYDYKQFLIALISAEEERNYSEETKSWISTTVLLSLLGGNNLS